MQFGVHVFPTEHSIQPDELARAAEECGLDSVWFSEHSHIPVRFLTAPGRGPAYHLALVDLALGKGRTESGVAQSQMLEPEDVAEAILFACTQSERARIIQIQMRTMAEPLA